MKALFVNPYWDTLGGGERYTATLIKLLLDYSWQVDINFHSNLSKEILNRFDLDISQANWLNQKYNPNLTLNYNMLFFLSDGSLPISLSAKTIIHLQFPFRKVGGNHPFNLLKSRFYNFVVNSAFTKSFIDHEYLVDSKLIYPPVDTVRFVSAKKTNTILYVGRFSNLTQSKGQSVLIDAFSQISQKLPGWKLVLAGGTSVGTQDNTIDKLKKMATGLPIEFITDPDINMIRKLYGHSKLFWSASGFGFDDMVNPTKVEHFGITVVEAMAAGCVPIITNLGGHKEIVNSGEDGFLWNTPTQLGEITLDLVNKPQEIKIMSKKAISVSAKFDTHNFNLSFKKLLNI